MAFTPATGQLLHAGFSNEALSSGILPARKEEMSCCCCCCFCCWCIYPKTECNLRLVITNQTLHKFRHRVWPASPLSETVSSSFSLWYLVKTVCLYLDLACFANCQQNRARTAELQRLLLGNGFCFVNLLGPTTQPSQPASQPNAWPTFMECALLRLDLDYLTGRHIGCGVWGTADN